MSGRSEVEAEIKKHCAIKRPHLQWQMAAGNVHQRIKQLISQKSAQS